MCVYGVGGVNTVRVSSKEKSKIVACVLKDLPAFFLIQGYLWTFFARVFLCLALGQLG